MVTNSAGELLFGRARREILGLLFGNPDESFFLRQIVRRTGVGLGPVQRELARLTGAGLVLRNRQGRQVYFRANRDSPVFEELRSLLVKTTGVADVLREALQPLADRIRVAFVYGSFARGDERRSSDVDLMIIGDVSFAEAVRAVGSAQQKLGREVNPTVYPVDEFARKLRGGRQFQRNVMEDAKIFLLGGECDLEGMAG